MTTLEGSYGSAAIGKRYITPLAPGPGVIFVPVIACLSRAQLAGIWED